MALNVQTTPERIMQGLNAFRLTAALKGAIELGLFTTIADGDNTSKKAAEALGASEKGVRILADYLAASGYLEKTGDRYALPTDVDQFLNRRSPMYIGSISRFLVRETIDDVEAAVRMGGTTQQENAMDPEHPIWEEFAKSMAPLMGWPAQLMAEKLCEKDRDVEKVLDIAAGHGLFGVAIAQRCPRAHIVAVDWKNVLEYAKQNAEQAGAGNRYELKPGSAFEVDFGVDYDLVLLTNFLHHFSVEKNTTLLKKVRAALKPGGRLAILEFVPNDDRVSPAWPAQFALMMLLGTQEGDAYTFSELKGMLEDAGFKEPSRTDIVPTPQTLLVARA